MDTLAELTRSTLVPIPPPVPTIAALLNQLGKMPGHPALMGVCTDGLPLIVDFQNGKISNMLLDMQRMNAAKLLAAVLRSAYHWDAGFSFQLIPNNASFPAQPSGILLLPDRSDFFSDQNNCPLLHCLEERTAFVILVGSSLNLSSHFDLLVGIDAWGRWFAQDRIKNVFWDFSLPSLSPTPF